MLQAVQCRQNAECPSALASENVEHPTCGSTLASSENVEHRPTCGNTLASSENVERPTCGSTLASSENAERRPTCVSALASEHPAHGSAIGVKAKKVEHPAFGVKASVVSKKELCCSVDQIETILIQSYMPPPPPDSVPVILQYTDPF